jgi:protein-L-isoaspartate O-methyltransferase
LSVWSRGTRLAAIFFIFISFAVPCAAWPQKPEFDFYREFRNIIVPELRAANSGVSDEEILQRYAAILAKKGVPEKEIARRRELISTEKDRLESDYWNRFYLNPDSNFNRSPNGFLMKMIEGRSPGTALDYGMGEGRNAIYLAKLGWEVWGFDPADAAVAQARSRAEEFGLRLHAEAARDSEYEFGKDRFDLILFSWTMPLIPVARVVDSLKEGGIVVMECGVDFTGRNGMLQLFDSLEVEFYEITAAKSDFYDRRETGVLRLVARKTHP